MRKSRRKESKRNGGGRVFNPDKSLMTLGAFNSLVNSDKIIRVPLGGNLALVTDGSGILSAIATCDPSGGSGSSWTSDEYTAYQDRYTYVRCLGLRVTFTSVLANDSKTGDQAPAVIAWNMASQSAPTAYASVEDNVGIRSWNMASDTSKNGVTFYHSHKSDLGWLPTTSPSAVTGPYAGCPGGIGIYASGIANLSSRVGTMLIVGIYEFRSKK